MLCHVYFHCLFQSNKEIIFILFDCLPVPIYVYDVHYILQQHEWNLKTFNCKFCDLISKSKKTIKLTNDSNKKKRKIKMIISHLCAVAKANHTISFASNPIRKKRNAFLFQSLKKCSSQHSNRKSLILKDYPTKRRVILRDAIPISLKNNNKTRIVAHRAYAIKRFIWIFFVIVRECEHISNENHLGFGLIQWNRIRMILIHFKN